MKKVIGLFIIIFLISFVDISSAIIINKSTENKIININNTSNNYSKMSSYNENADIDPLVDLEVTVTIKEIRALYKSPEKIKNIIKSNFYVVLFINNQKFKSKIWFNQDYVKDAWSVTLNVPDDEENVTIQIQLWDWKFGINNLCDISSVYDTKFIDKRYIDIIYSLESSHWRGDDFIGDPSGYGRANGCDDGSILNKDKDCELWFDISQNDYDNDGIPYWTEVNVYKTDPKVDDTGRDDDNDSIPIEWEFKWGHQYHYDWHSHEYESYWIYNPFKWDNHTNLDPDNDGLQNTKEYLTSQWGSDPFRQDIFIELDQMAIGPNGEGFLFPDKSKELIRDAYSRHNIVYLIDDGYMGGGETIPFQISTSNEELQNLYRQYFLHYDSNNWRRGVFHYTLILYTASYCGFAFSSMDNNTRLMDCLQLSTNPKIQRFASPLYPIIDVIRRRSLNIESNRAIYYASVLMHETGHLLGIYSGNTPGCDVSGIAHHLKYLNYVSCMNYFYCYYIIDYSDGSHGKNDFDDWNRIDLTLFQIKYPI